LVFITQLKQLEFFQNLKPELTNSQLLKLPIPTIVQLELLHQHSMS